SLPSVRSVDQRPFIIHRPRHTTTMATFRKDKRASLTALDPPLSPIAEEGAVRKVSTFKRFFSTRPHKSKKMGRSLTLDTPSMQQKEKDPRPRNLSFELPHDDSDPGVNSASSSSAASTCSEQSFGRTISSDGAGLLEPISAQAKAFSCTSINSNGNTDESDGPLRISISNADSENNTQINAGSRTASKHKYFSQDSDRSFIKKYFQPSFAERNAQFRKLFGELVPEDEQMLASFSCAYQREILVQGRIFISSRHFCFYANIFGWGKRGAWKGTLFAIPMTDVKEITKEKAVLIFPNSVQLNCENGSHFFFASFANRDKSLKVMQLAWKQLKATGEAMAPEELWDLMNPANETNEEKPEKVNEKRTSKREKGSPSVSSAEEPNMQKTSSAPNIDPIRAAAGACSALDDSDAAERSSTSSTTDVSMSECLCDDHKGRMLLDHIFPRSPSELFDLIFTSSPWFVQLNSALQRTAYAKMPQNYSGYVASDWATDKDGVRNRTCTYTMALNQAMAPKSCVVTEKQIYKEFPGGFTISKETQNSGVPYCDSFFVHCTYCVMRYGSGQTRLVVHGALVFRKSVWSVIRGYIEKSTAQGLDDHYNALFGALTEECKRQAGGADEAAMALEDDEQNRMDTSSEEGGETEAGTTTMRGMAGSISGINFVHHARGKVQEEPYFELPFFGRVRRLDFYGMGIMSLLGVLCYILLVLVTRLPLYQPSPAESRIAQAFDRYLSPDSAHNPPAAAAAQPDLDALIAAIAKIGAQLQQLRDAAPNARGGEL
ncbi:hypothetical protein PFISCL1PPCAC_18865, partial [Pristionchus fissidentatus]